MTAIDQNCYIGEESSIKVEEKAISMKGIHYCDYEECNKLFKDKRSWEEHMRFHKGEKPFICDLSSCQKQFSRLSSLLKHKRIHEGNKPYRCKICNHTFTQSSNLRRHERIHSGEKPYSCEFCQKTFLTNSNLKQHKIIHMDMRNKYKCEQCDRAYFYKSSLKKHLIAHEKEDKDLKTKVKAEDIKLEQMVEDSSIDSLAPAIIKKEALPEIAQAQPQNEGMFDLKRNPMPGMAYTKDMSMVKPQISQSINNQNEINNLLNKDYANFMYMENPYEEMSTKQGTPFEESSILYDSRRHSDRFNPSMLFSRMLNNNFSPKQSSGEALSEMDPRDYKLIRAMQSKDLVFIDSDDEEEPVKQVKSAPATFKTEMISGQNEVRVSQPVYHMENLFALESNYFKEKELNSFIIEEKPAQNILETDDYFNEF